MPSSGFVPESANRVCLLLSILSLSIPFLLYLFALGSALRVFSSAVRPTFGQRRFVTVTSFSNLRRFCNWCRQFFVLSGSVSQRLSCILWRLLQGAYPLEHWR